ncbi:MAG: electron transfer flavoprotein subunit beta/FixA family protein [Oscillospiraceae bacterium]|nr:electron transfer flavoprotein subunit beta/FixA family protein [Oscillospiraceae bacterium]MBR3555509.1 electron transfer flavoprotein subunit beta/FixA family protein [Oscillospiraceae bacterium]
MKIIVTAKQVPDTNEVKIDPVKHTLIRDGVPSILNPDDKNALEGALALKDQYPGSTVTVISMGPPQALIMLKECIAMGADDAALLSSRAFGGADTCATSTTIAAGIKKIGDYDIIFAGRQAIDGDTAQVGPQTAMRLGVPVVSYVQKVVEVNEKERYAIVERQLEDGHEVVKVTLPCVLTCVKELNEPRYMTVGRIIYACEKADIKIWNEKDVELDPADCGLNASPTKVDKSFTPDPKGKGEMLSGTIHEMSAKLVGSLREKHVI